MDVNDTDPESDSSRQPAAAAPPTVAGRLPSPPVRWPTPVGTITIVYAALSLLVLVLLLSSPTSSSTTSITAGNQVVVESTYSEWSFGSETADLGALVLMTLSGGLALAATVGGAGLLMRKRWVIPFTRFWLGYGVLVVALMAVGLAFSGSGAGEADAGDSGQGGWGGVVFTIAMASVGLVLLSVWYAGLPALVLLLNRRSPLRP